MSDPAIASQVSTASTSRPRSAATLVPSNTVTTKAGVTVRARIDPALAVADVIRQLVLSLKLPEPPAEFALRDDAEELVTDENMRRKIINKVPLKCVHRSEARLQVLTGLPGLSAHLL
jgi:engulfment/cell motility protein 1